MIRRGRALVAGTALLAGLLAAALLWFRFDAWIAATELPALLPDVSVEVLARDGSLLRAYPVGDGRWRLALDPERVDAGYVAMLLAWEDQRFYRHSGVDPLALLRAVGQALMHKRVVSGGSTLSMQVARLIEDGPTGQWAGKWRQIRVALALERQLSKHDILALYLHHAPYGGNLEGLRAASLAWFGKEPTRLTPAEAALLVALPQSPEARRPDRHPARAAAARDRVLQRMAGLGLLDTEAAAAAQREPVPEVRRAFPQHAPHLADRLRAADPAAQVHVTTIDIRLQMALEALAARAVAGQGAALNVAMLIAEHGSGEILASVGSAQYTASARLGYIDMTRASRSPGSTLKPLVYGLAFADGRLHPSTLLLDRPASYDGYAPRNIDGRFRGPVTATEALQRSLNLPVVELTHALGPARLIAALRAAGVHADIPGEVPGLAVALGGLGITLHDLVQVYAAIARGGNAVMLTSLREPDGTSTGLHLPAVGILLQHSTADAATRQGNAGASPVGISLPQRQVLPPEAAWQLATILVEAPRPGWLPEAPLAFKTGTSYGHRDALAVGFDGVHVGAVWMGRADGTPVPGLYGVEHAAPLLFEAFARAAPVMTPLPTPPPGVLQATNAQLPDPLRAFGAARRSDTAAGPVLRFPPDGAVMTALDGQVLVRVERGVPPFTWLADGVPVLTASAQREAMLPLPGPGFVALAVVDAQGQAARVRIELR